MSEPLPKMADASAAIEALRLAVNNTQSRYAVVYVGWSGCSSTPTHEEARKIAETLCVDLQYVNFERSVMGWPAEMTTLPALKGFGTEIEGKPEKFGLSGPSGNISLYDTQTGRVLAGDVPLFDALQTFRNAMEKEGAPACAPKVSRRSGATLS